MKKIIKCENCRGTGQYRAASSGTICMTYRCWRCDGKGEIEIKAKDRDLEDLLWPQ